MAVEGAGTSLRADDLPALALSSPEHALSRARAVLLAPSDRRAESFAHQAVGIVLRDRGRTREALVEIRAALRAATVTGDQERIVDVRATLGGSLVVAGRIRAGLAELDAAEASAPRAVHARVLLRRATIYLVLGRHHDALVDMQAAISGLRSAGDTVWEARARNNRSAIHVARGDLDKAERDNEQAQRLFRSVGQEFEFAMAVQNGGTIRFCRGDLPGCLREYAEAGRLYAGLSVSWPDLAVDQAHALVAAGLTPEAVQVLSLSLTEPELQPTRRAELLYSSAAAALAGGDVPGSLERARQARDLFKRQQRDWWEARAELVVLRARWARGDRQRVLLDRAAELGEQFARLRTDDAPVALLMAGRLAAERWPAEAPAHLAALARYRRHAAPLVRATGWLGKALDRELAGDSRGVLNACGKGLDALDDHRTTLGSSELRALASGHGQDLARLALREVTRTGGARRMLAWSERWRATALTEPPVRPPRDSRTAAELGTLRSLSRRRDEALREDEDPATLERDRRAWEQAVRAQRHQLAGTRRATARFDVAGFVDQVGDATFVELVEVDGVLHALTVMAGRVRHTVVGPVDAGLQAVAAALFALRQAGRGRPTTLDGVGERLRTTLLGATPLGSGPVVISPPSRLHGAPWTLIPSLAGRPVSVVPSGVMWQRARAVERPAEDRLVLVAGPGLRTGGAEVDVLAGRVPEARLLRDGSATVEATMAALDGAALAHVAAHGDFRPDSPMFSALRLDDGPLTVHDLELLDKAPYRLVLSACDSGVMAPVGADELLGLTSALLSMGTAGIVASVAEVNDDATVVLMLDLHAGLAAGAGVAEAMCAARERARGDLVAEATAAAFVALGV